MSRFDGKKVLITGGTRGIGKAAALAFQTEGARVVIAGYNADSMASALSEIQGAGDSDDAVIEGVIGDIAKVADCERVVSFAVEQMAGLDILVNSAGVFQLASMQQTDEVLWDRIMSINVKGSYFCSRAALPALRRAATENIPT